MKDKTDLELKSIIEKAVYELHSRGYDIQLLGITGKPRRMPVVECRKVITL